MRFTGNVASDPRMAQASGVDVANFSVAVTPRVKDGTNWKDGEPVWYEVAAWSHLGVNAAARLHKGDRVTVEGDIIAPRAWEANGKSGITIRVRATNVALTIPAWSIPGSEPQRQQEPQQEERWYKPGATTAGSADDEVPF